MEERIAAPHFTYHFVCRDAEGNVLWTETCENLVTTQGGNDLIDKYFKGSAYTAGWFMGLKGTGTVSLTDTAASHAGWSEINPYTGNRPAITFGTTASKSNTATGVVFTATSSTTVYGAFVQSVNTGTTGILYSASDFGTPQPVVSTNTLTVTLTVSV